MLEINLSKKGKYQRKKVRAKEKSYKYRHSKVNSILQHYCATNKKPGSESNIARGMCHSQRNRFFFFFLLETLHLKVYFSFWLGVTSSPRCRRIALLSNSHEMNCIKKFVCDKVFSAHIVLCQSGEKLMI